MHDFPDNAYNKFRKGKYSCFGVFFVMEGFVLIWLWVLIVFLLIFLTILILSYVQGEVHFSRVVEQDYMELKIKAKWGVKFNRFFPMIKLMDYSKRFHSHRIMQRQHQILPLLPIAVTRGK
jgi:hypothetical protein